MSGSKEESIEMPITEAPKKAGEGLGTVEGELQEEKKKKKNLRKKLIELKQYDGPRYMQANTWLRRYVRLTKNTIIIMNTNININSRFCFDWCCTDLNRHWPPNPMAEYQVRGQ